MIGRFGYGAVDKSAEYAFLARKYVPDPNARLRVYEQVSSEYIFVGTAVLLNKILSRDGSLDITIIGFVHALAFLYAFYRLLVVTGPLRAWSADLDIGVAGSHRCRIRCLLELVLRGTGFVHLFLIAAGREHRDLSCSRGLKLAVHSMGSLGSPLRDGETAECSARNPDGVIYFPPAS